MKQPQRDVISEITGEWGPWQLRTSLLIFLCKIPSSWFMACIIFTAPLPRDGEYFCKLPASESLSSSATFQNQTQWLHEIHPPKTEQNNSKLDYCHIYKTIYENTSFLDNTTQIIPCNTFQHNAPFVSLVSQFNLVCSRGILVAVTQFFHLFGVLTGGIIATKLLEYVSPRKLMLAGMITQVFCGLLTGTATVFEVHIFFRYLSAVCCAQMFTAGPVIFQELTGGKYRTSVTCLYENFWSIGVILLPGIAYLFPDWTNIYIAISLPTLCYMILWFLIPDAPRWLLNNAQPDKTTKILLQSIKTNRKENTLPSDIGSKLKLLRDECDNIEPPLGWWSLWRNKTEIIRMIALHTAWAVYVTNYNGMLLNVKAFSREYLSINTIVFGCSEIVGVLFALFLILKTKRKWLWTGLFNIFAGIFCSVVYSTPQGLSEVQTMIFQMIPATLAKSAVSTSQAVLFTCTGELVLPEQRKSCVFSCVVWARIWLLTAPFIGALMVYHPMLPLVVFGLLSAIGGISTAVLLIPKTKHSKSALPIEPLIPNQKNIG